MEQLAKHTEHTRKRYNAAARLYNLLEWPVEQLWYQQWREQMWEKVGGSDILEIGVGTGKNIPFYPDESNVTGIDLSPNMLQRAESYVERHGIPDVTLFEMDAQQLEFTDHAFDTVIATFVFCSIPDPVRALNEAWRVTKPGGRLLLLEHQVSDAGWLAAPMKALDRPMHYVSGVHIARNTVANVQRSKWNLNDVQTLSRTGIFKRMQGVKVV